FPRQILRHRDGLARVHERVLGERAGAAAHHARPGADDFARGFLAGRLGGARLDEAADDQLAAVESRRLDLDEKLSRARLGLLDLALLEHRFSVDRLDEESSHSAFTPAFFTTLPQVAYSRFMYAARLSGVPGSGSTPCLCSR